MSDDEARELLEAFGHAWNTHDLERRVRADD